MNEAEFADLLQKYVKGECTEFEKQFVKQWYASFDNDPDFIAGLDMDAERELEERIYDKILNTIDLPNSVKILPGHPKKVRTLRIWYSAAAAIAVFIGVALFFHKSTKSPNHLTAEVVTSGFIYVSNNTNKLLKSVLPDNSTVWLSPHAHIRYPKVFDTRLRLISMSGECFFEVTKNPKQPFVISSRSIITKVWGTSFVVDDRNERDSAEVSVITGKVSVHIKSKNKDNDNSPNLQKSGVMLYPHQKAVYAVSQQILKKESTENEASLQLWNRVSLSFDNRPLKEIIPVLNDKFHVQLSFADDKLNHYILHGDFDGFNLPEILESLKTSLNINYRINNNKIELISTN
jgi:ferric-dicitrate binding protein FerR (iron transport regulator)